MILSDKEIREYSLRSGDPLIEGFCEDQLQGASYDVSISEKLTILKHSGSIIDLSNDDDVDIYEQKIIDNNGYLLLPGEYILAELMEKFNIPSNLIAHVRPRTRFTRCGILIADQHFNPTYRGVLQVGIFNGGANSILLKKGVRIAQIVFEELKSIPDENKLYMNKKNAAYMNENTGDFRGSKFGESGWSDAGKELYHHIMVSLQEEDEIH